jgi:hypothetical protein
MNLITTEDAAKIFISMLVADGYCDTDDYNASHFTRTTETTDDMKAGASDWKDIQRGWIKCKNWSIDRIQDHQFKKSEPRSDLLIADFGHFRLALKVF